MPAPTYGPEYGYLKVDSERRELELARAIRRSLKLDLDVPDDRLSQVLTAEYLAEFDRVRSGEFRADEVDSEKLARFIVDRRKLDVPTPLSSRLIDARTLYESFFEADVPRDVAGWSTELIAVAADLYTRPALEIAVSVWTADRSRARRELTPSSARPPQLEFDHALLGFGRYLPLAPMRSKTEPFFRVRQPIEGVCGVTRAWMFLSATQVDTYAGELVAHYRAELPEAYEWIADAEQAIPGRPLGFYGTPLAAEAFARHLTIQEGALFVFDELAAVMERSA